MPQRMKRLLRRQVDRFARPYVDELHREVVGLGGRVDALQQSVDSMRDQIEEELRGLRATVGTEMPRANEMLRHIHEEDTAQRRRLYSLRASEDYELPFTESEPLVSFVIPTHDRFETLRDVSLPSILEQTYSNIEVIVAGDGSPPQTEEVIAEFDDERVRFCNRSVRGPYPADKSTRWYMIGTPPYNDGVALCRGRWIAALGDDDAVRPEHTEVLLEEAQEQRYEHCYGRHHVHYRGGETLEVGVFPPERGEFVLQASIYHAGLSFFQMEPADRHAAEPNDWSLCRRMLAAGVRFGMVDRIVADKYESRYKTHDEWGIHGVPSVD